MQNPEKEWFGEEKVSPDEKTGLVGDVFDSVADKYDLMNDLMSGGVHRLWKDHLVRKIRPRAGLHYLDVAGGTGDIAFRIKRGIEKSRNRETEKQKDNNIRSSIPPFLRSSITLCDINPSMLSLGRDRAIDRGYLDDFEWITGNAECLPIPDNSVDVYTIAFGLRNVTHIDTALVDAFRVLRPGGRFYCLEFSTVKDPVLAKLYDAFSFKIIPKIGGIVAKDSSSYQYLVESIRKFPNQENLANRMGSAGFVQVKYESLSFGIAAIHQGVKV